MILYSELDDTHFLCSVVRRDDDHKKPKQVLQYPAVTEFRFGYRAVYVERLVVDVDQGHHAQGDQRQGQLDTEHVVQLVDRLARQPVPNPERLDDRLQRTPERVLQNGRSDDRPPRPPKRRRIPIADHHVRPDGRQFVVDAPELQVRREAQQHEMRLHAAHAPVLQVHVEKEQRQHEATVMSLEQA